MKKQLKPKVTYKKLGRSYAYAQVDDPSLTPNKRRHRIEIDSRIKGKRRLALLLHELAHLQNPEWSESMVLHKSAEAANLLWSQKYRRVELDAKKD